MVCVLICHEKRGSALGNERRVHEEASQPNHRGAAEGVPGEAQALHADPNSCLNRVKALEEEIEGLRVDLGSGRRALIDIGAAGG